MEDFLACDTLKDNCQLFNVDESLNKKKEHIIFWLAIFDFHKYGENKPIQLALNKNIDHKAKLKDKKTFLPKNIEQFQFDNVKTINIPIENLPICYYCCKIIDNDDYYSFTYNNIDELDGFHEKIKNYATIHNKTHNNIYLCKYCKLISQTDYDHGSSCEKCSKKCYDNIKQLPAIKPPAIYCNACGGSIYHCNDYYYIFNYNANIISNVNPFNGKIDNTNINVCRSCYNKYIFKIDKTHIINYLDLFIENIDKLIDMMSMPKQDFIESTNDNILKYAWFVYNIFKGWQIPKFKKINCCYIDQESSEYKIIADPNIKFFSNDVLIYMDKLIKNISAL